MPPRPRAGDLRQVITIQKVTKTDDGMGGSTEAWGTFIRTRAAIWPVSAKEIVKDAQLVQEITHQVRTRYQDGILSGMRIIFGSRTFEILTIVNTEERDVLLDLMCREDT